MSEEEIAAEIAAEEARAEISARNQEIRETARSRRARRSIKAMSPSTSRKTQSALRRLQSAHRAKIRTRRAREHKEAVTREAKKKSRLRKQKTMREVKKFIKDGEVALDKDNVKMLAVLVEKNIPVEVAVQIAENRQALQTNDKNRLKTIKRLQAEIEGLKSILPGTRSAIEAIERDLLSIEEYTSDDSDVDSEDNWQEWYVEEEEAKLGRLKRREQELTQSIAEKTAALQKL